jgi:DNA-binding transcriptional MerR regulator
MTLPNALKNLTQAEIAELLDVSAATLMCFEEHGLLAKGIGEHAKVYNRCDLARARIVLRCRTAGYTFDSVRRLLGAAQERTQEARQATAELEFSRIQLQSLKERLARADRLERVNLQCDADLLDAYIIELRSLAQHGAVRQQKFQDSGEETVFRLSSTPPKYPPHRSNDQITHALRNTARHRRIEPPRRSNDQITHVLRNTARHRRIESVWSKAIPIFFVLSIGLVVAYFYARDQKPVIILDSPESIPAEVQKPASKQLETPPEAQPPDSDQSEPDKSLADNTSSLSERDEDRSAPQPVALLPGASLADKAASDLKTLLEDQAHTRTTAHKKPPPPKIGIVLEDLSAFFEMSSRVLRIKVKLSQVGSFTTTVTGKLIVLLHTEDIPDIQWLSIPYSEVIAGRPAPSSKGEVFSFSGETVIYLKTDLAVDPGKIHSATVFAYDLSGGLLLAKDVLLDIRRL